MLCVNPEWIRKSESLAFLSRDVHANNVCRMIHYMKEAGFYKQGEVTFPHKQSAVMKIERDSWEAPEL